MNGQTPVKFLLIFSLITLFSILFTQNTGWCADSAALRQGIDDYHQENFEEAIVSLLKASRENPSSAEAAYYTGLTYRELLNYESAKTWLNKALSLKPSLTEAYVPLAEVLYSFGETGEAEKYLEKAGEQGSRSARASYLSGLILSDQGEKKEAAREFKTAIALEPESEAALLSGGLLNTMGYRESQLALSVGYTFQYDDNVILKPSEDISGLAVSDEKDTRHVLTAGADYSTVRGRAGLRAAYSFYQSLHQDLDHMDVQAHSLNLIPSLRINKGSIYLLGGYDYYLIDNDEYLKTITLKPSWTFITEGGKGVNLFAGMIYKDFLQKALSKDEERDGTNVNAGLGILFPFNADKSYVKLSYTYDSEDTDGSNWDYSGHKGTLLLSHPLAQAMALSLNGNYYLQDYKNTHVSFGKKREDKILEMEATLTYSFKGIDFNVHYSYTNSDSNITAYDYSRNIAGVGAEYSF